VSKSKLPLEAVGLALAALTLLGSAPASAQGPALYDSAALDDPSVGRCDWLGRTRPFVFQESDYIRGYFEATNLDAYRRALPAPFAMPGPPLRPMIRVAFIDFYEMAEGPTYRETEIAVLAMDGAQAGWIPLTLPVTNGVSCIGGRQILGLPKVVRRITLERAAGRYVGTLYAQGGERPQTVLTVEIGEPVEGVRELLRQYGVYPQFGLLGGKVLKYGGSGQSYAELMRRGDYEIRLGRARLDVSPEPENLLRRLGVGAPLAAHWSRIRARYTITPM
jgi:Acetoacetate decarboxylase (ADC)